MCWKMLSLFFKLISTTLVAYWKYCFSKKWSDTICFNQQTIKIDIKNLLKKEKTSPNAISRIWIYFSALTQWMGKEHWFRITFENQKQIDFFFQLRARIERNFFVIFNVRDRIRVWYRRHHFLDSTIAQKVDIRSRMLSSTSR